MSKHYYYPLFIHVETEVHSYLLKDTHSLEPELTLLTTILYCRLDKLPTLLPEILPLSTHFLSVRESVVFQNSIGNHSVVPG